MANKKPNRFVRWIKSLGVNKETTENTLAVKEAPSSKKANILKKVGLAFVTGAGGNSLNFEGPEGLDFEEIEKAYLTDSYIRAAVDKYVDFMFKAGWDITGKNPNSVEYIKLRLAAMEQATQTPSDQLFLDIAEELIKYHNAFIVKARASGSYAFPPGVRVSPLDGKKPVAGYYILPTATITIARDKNGTIKRYQQDIAGGETIEFKPEDIIHIYVDKQPGRAFGFPFLWEVLDDVKLLRQMEELVDRMIYKNIFPLMVYQVGLEQEGFQASDEEVNEVRDMLGELTMDGGIVLPERHNIKVIGAEGQALDVQQYLNYFENRVFTGLGVSPTIMGRGDTSNRSTSDNMDVMFKDRIKAYQKIASIFINNFMITELLTEGGFDPVLRPEDRVDFRFREIDFDSKIKEENHVIQKFTQNAITHDELRTYLGLDPVTDEGRLYFNMITGALQAQAAQEKIAAANNAGANKDKPANQHGTKLSPKKKESLEEALNSANLESLETRWELGKAELIDVLRKNGQLTQSKIEMTANITIQSMKTILEKNCESSFLEGINKFSQASHKSPRFSYGYNIQFIKDDVGTVLSKLSKDLVSQIMTAEAKGVTTSDKIANVAGAFNALKYRIKFITNTESSKAYNNGFSKAAREVGYKELEVATTDGCPVCSALENKTINLYTDNLPPFHPNCTCRLTVPESKKEGD